MVAKLSTLAIGLKTEDGPWLARCGAWSGGNGSTVGRRPVPSMGLVCGQDGRGITALRLPHEVLQSYCQVPQPAASRRNAVNRAATRGKGRVYGSPFRRARARVEPDPPSHAREIHVVNPLSCARQVSIHCPPPRRLQGKGHYNAAIGRDFESSRPVRAIPGASWSVDFGQSLPTGGQVPFSGPCLEYIPRREFFTLRGNQCKFCQSRNWMLFRPELDRIAISRDLGT